MYIRYEASPGAAGFSLLCRLDARGEGVAAGRDDSAAAGGVLASKGEGDVKELEALAAKAWEGLPGEFRKMCGRVDIFVADFADKETLGELGMQDPFELTGVYMGVDLGRKSVIDPSPEPDRVILFRRPILDEWAERGDIPLGELISHVLVHEIGHHFGLSDADMHRIEDQA